MLFEISRTSELYNKPCEEAKQELLTHVDLRAVATLEEAKTKIWFQPWFDKTVNHREENGYIAADNKEKQPVWTIEINSIAKLLAFQKKYGPLILEPSSFKELVHSIEIYDDYR